MNPLQAVLLGLQVADKALDVWKLYLDKLTPEQVQAQAQIGLDIYRAIGLAHLFAALAALHPEPTA